MGFYDKIAATTARMIQQYGMSVTLRHMSEGAPDYNPSAGGVVPTGTDGTYDEQRFLLKLDQPGSQIAQRFGQNRMDETLIERNVKWAYMDASGPPPNLQDKIIMEGIEFSLIDIQVCGPQGIPVYYQLVMRT